MFRAAVQLGVNPQSFWRLSLREWRWLAAPAAGALSRTAFADLAERFPDTQR
jgi:hypothetical protein